MKLTPIIEALVAGDATPEMILRAVRAYEQQQDDTLEKRRATDAKRQAEKRAREKSRDIQGHHSDRLLTGEGARVEDKPLPTEIEPQGKKEAARATRLPEDWTLPDDMRAEAISMGLAPQRCDVEAATMRDWSRSNANGAKRDWRAAWRNWVRRALERVQPRAGPVNGAPTLAQVFGMVREKAAENEQRRGSGEGTGAVVLNLPAVRAQ